MSSAFLTRWDVDAVDQGEWSRNDLGVNIVVIPVTPRLAQDMDLLRAVILTHLEHPFRGWESQASVHTVGIPGNWAKKVGVTTVPSRVRITGPRAKVILVPTMPNVTK